MRLALAMLPAEQREALILVGAGGFAYEEAAEICGCAVGTVKSRVSRARRALQSILEAGAYRRDGRAASQAMGAILAAAEQMAQTPSADSPCWHGATRERLAMARLAWRPFTTIRSRLGAAVALALLPVLLIGVVQANIAFRKDAEEQHAESGARRRAQRRKRPGRARRRQCVALRPLDRSRSARTAPNGSVK